MVAEMASAYKFLDGDGDADFNQHGPRLLHFCSTLGHVQVASWEKLISENRSLPALTITVRDEGGNLRCTRNFQTSRDLEGSVVGQDSHIANASVDLEVSVTDASNRWLCIVKRFAQSGFRNVPQYGGWGW